eukprot:2560212-Amphidinium_carterae.1
MPCLGGAGNSPCSLTQGGCLDCERHLGGHTGCSCFNYHALRGGPCVVLKRKKRAHLLPGFKEAVLVQEGQNPPWPELAELCRLLHWVAKSVF